MMQENQDSFYQSESKKRLLTVLMAANKVLVMLCLITFCVQAGLIVVISTQCHQIDGITLTGNRFQSFSLSCPGINGHVKPVNNLQSAPPVKELQSAPRSEEHTPERQSLMGIPYAAYLL